MAREKYCVGIDIGSSAVKLCQLTTGKSGLVLEQFGQVLLPQGTIVDGEVVDSSSIVDAIKKLKATHKIKNKHAAFSVSGASVIIKKITVPSMSSEELELNIQWEAEQYIPFNIDEVNLDFHVLQNTSTEQGHMEVILVAVKKTYIDEFISIITQAGFEPAVCDVDAFALENMFLGGYEFTENESVALVNVGATKTNINILTNGVSSFTRDLQVGGNSFTTEIGNILGISQDEAEAIKLGDTEDANAITPEVEEAIQGVADNITSELQRTIDFYSATSADAPPSQIFLTGGSARLEVLEQSIKSRMWVTVTQIDPFNNLDTGAHEPAYLANQAPSAAIAVGLALRYPGDS